MVDILSLSYSELEKQILDLGLPKYRTAQIVQWLGRGCRNFDEMTNLPNDLRQRLSAQFSLFAPELLRKQVSAEELRALCRKYKKEFFRFGSIFKRGFVCFKRTKNPFINFAYWFINILFHYEVDKRIGIPVGENMD